MLNKFPPHEHGEDDECSVLYDNIKQLSDMALAAQQAPVKECYVPVSVDDELPEPEKYKVGVNTDWSIDVIGVTKYDLVKGYFNIPNKQFFDYSNGENDETRLNEDVTHWLKKVPVTEGLKEDNK